MKPEKFYPNQLTSASMMSYEDFPLHKLLMTSDEKNDFRSESTLDILWGLTERVIRDRSASSKRPGPRWVSALQGARLDGLQCRPGGEGVYSDGSTPHVG